MTDQEQFKKLDAGTPVNPDIEATKWFGTSI